MSTAYVAYWTVIAAIFLVLGGLIWREARRRMLPKNLFVCKHCGCVNNSQV